MRLVRTPEAARATLLTMEVVAWLLTVLNPRLLRRSARLFSACTIVLLAGCGSSGDVAPPAECVTKLGASARDIAPGWAADGSAVYFIHRARSGLDSNCVSIVDTSGLRVPIMRVPDGVQECAYRGDGTGLVFRGGSELYFGLYSSRAIRPLTSGGRGAHWPQWNPSSSLICYSRVLRFAADPDSMAGIRVLNPDVGTDRAVMRSATRVWKARGPVAWSPAGDRLAFFDGDTLSSGLSRLVVVDLAGVLERTVGWAEGVPGGISWGPAGDYWLFDTTPRDCPDVESERRTFVMRGTGSVEPVSHELGDSRVFAGYPFSMNSAGDRSAHVGLVGGVGLIVVTDAFTGVRTVLTTL